MEQGRSLADPATQHRATWSRRTGTGLAAFLPTTECAALAEATQTTLDLVNAARNEERNQ